MSDALFLPFDEVFLSAAVLRAASIQAECEVRAVCIQIDVSYVASLPLTEDHVDAGVVGIYGLVIYARPGEGPTVISETAVREFGNAVVFSCREDFQVSVVALPTGIPFDPAATKRFLGCFKAADLGSQIRRIPATIMTDDRAHRVHFDAEAWFIQADDRAIRALVACGFGGDYAADAVGLWMSEFRDDVAVAIDHSCVVKSGFEVHVEVAHAVMWLAEHRPHLVPAEEDDDCDPMAGDVTPEPAVS